MRTKKVIEHELPASFIGSRRSIVSISFGDSTCGRKVYIQAGLHADEAPGYVVADRLLRVLTEADERGEINGHIVMVPVANPIGLAQWNTDTVRGRFDDCDLLNFNRHYPDMSEIVGDRVEGKLSSDAQSNIQFIRETYRQALSEYEPASEAQFLKHKLLSLAFDADIVLDLHCDFQAALHIYTGTTLWPDARDLSAQMGAKATLLAVDSGNLPFDEANSKIWWDLANRFPDFSIPPACLAATVELRGTADTSPAQVEADSMNLFSFLQRRGYILGQPGNLPDLIHEATPLEGVDYISAEAAGILMYHRNPGDVVAEGEVLADLIQPHTGLGESRTIQIKSNTAGVMFARSSDRFARPGKIVAKVAGAKPLAGKGKNLLTI